MNIGLRDAAVFRPITRIGPDGRRLVDDCLLKEERFRLLCDDRLVDELCCLPFQLKELAVGHLFCLGLLRSPQQITALDIDARERSIAVRLAPGEEKAFAEDAAVLDSRAVLRLQRAFNQRCELFRRTGSAHSCALADSHGLLLFMEDVARHNALDKVIGAMLLRGMSPEGKVLLFSGRLAGDMLDKAARSGVKILVAPGAPSLTAVELAERSGITLLGFVRGDNINIYTLPDRIRGDQLE